MEAIAWGIAAALLGLGLGVGVALVRRRGRSDELALWASGEELWEVDAVQRRLYRRGHLPSADRLDAAPRAGIDDFLLTVHPEDRAMVAASMRRVLEGRDEFADVAFRSGLTDGSWIWLHSRGRVAARDASGRVTRVLGTTRAISALKESEQRLRLALQGAAEELWEIDLRSGAVRRENMRPEIAFEASNLDETRAGLQRLLHPDDFAELGRQLAAASAGQLAEIRVSYRVRRPDGQYWWMNSQGQALDPDAQGRPRRLLGTTRNITELKENEERLRLALWGSRAELWDIDMSSGRIVREGDQAQLAVPAAGAPISFRDLLDASHPDDVEPLKAAMVAHAKGESDGFEATFRTRDAAGAWRWVMARGRVTARDAQGWANRMLGTVHDVGALKDVETQLRALNEELEQRVAARTAELARSNAELTATVEQVRDAQRQLVEAEKMAALGALVAGVAHEINTPLGIGVTAASHLGRMFETIAQAQPEAPSPELAAALAGARRCVDLVLRNLERADQLVKSFKQIAIDQHEEQPRRLALRAYLDEVLTSLQPLLKRRPLTVEVDCDPAFELVTYAGALYQILMNLVVNSATHGFAPEQAGTLRIAARRQDDELRLDYSDDGRGMPPEVVARVFEPFFTTRRGSGGTGLGMHICYNLVTQRLRGTIRCESAPGVGVRFEIRVPLAAPARPAPAPLAAGVS
jgi:signal transduction histidine kinase